MIDLNALAHSHDQLEIAQIGDRSCVRKTFTGDIDRAVRNVEKQRAFRPLHTGETRIAAAEVLSFARMDDRAELVMPYVEGLSGAMFAVHGSHVVAQTLSTALSVLLHAELAQSVDTPVPTAVLTSKAADIAARTRDAGVRRRAERACERLAALPPEMIFPLGPCHGDLTLGNLILNPASGLVAIDFLHTFLESPLQDVAKLHQDFAYGWSFRRSPSALRVKAEIFCRHHTPQALAQLERLYGPQVRAMTLLTLLRIGPYLRDDATRDWLTNSLDRCLEIPLP